MVLIGIVKSAQSVGRINGAPIIWNTPVSKRDCISVSIVVSDRYISASITSNTLRSLEYVHVDIIKITVNIISRWNVIAIIATRCGIEISAADN